ncbi:MAG TPA: hypothetical protein VEA69_14965 [Tepidisphaeraceae bacterium]|nr:hypothetical protein [Tepidisphaeraceae bacterium]
MLRKYVDFWNFHLVLKARQEGVSTFFLIWHLDATLFTQNCNTCILADCRENLVTLFEIIKHAYETCPEEVQLADGRVWRKPKAKYDNRNELHFEGINSRIYVSLSVRSKTVHRLHVSEWAWIKNAMKVLTATFAAVPKTGVTTGETTASLARHIREIPLHKLYLIDDAEPLAVGDLVGFAGCPPRACLRAGRPVVVVVGDLCVDDARHIGARRRRARIDGELVAVGELVAGDVGDHQPGPEPPEVGLSTAGRRIEHGPEPVATRRQAILDPVVQVPPTAAGGPEDVAVQRRERLARTTWICIGVLAEHVWLRCDHFLLYHPDA